jgi:hypothetical protein
MSCDGVFKFKRRASQTHIRLFLVPRLGRGSPFAPISIAYYVLVLCRRASFGSGDGLR